MATVLTPRGSLLLGPGFKIDFGDYSCTDTSTTTLRVSGGYVIATGFYDGNQNPCCNAGTASTVTLSARSTSGPVTSYTLTPGGTAVTNGTYWVLHGGS